MEEWNGGRVINKIWTEETTQQSMWVQLGRDRDKNSLAYKNKGKSNRVLTMRRHLKEPKKRHK